MSNQGIIAVVLSILLSSYGCAKKEKKAPKHGEEKPLAFTDVPVVEDAGFDPDLVIIDKDWILNQSFSMSISAHDGNLTRQTFNVLQGKLVRFEISSGRLYILERPEGSTTHSNYPDLVLSSFPILKVNAANTKVQVDFSNPDDKGFVSNLLGQSASWKITSILASTPALKPCASQSLVNFTCLTDSTDLAVRYNVRVVSTEADAEENLSEISKGHVFYLGFTPTTEIDPSASTLKLDDAVKKMFSSGAVTDVTGRPDVTPYFLTDDILGTPNGSKQNPFQAVRRFDTSKPIEFVLSETTPKSMVDVVKSSVLAYARAFEVMGVPNAGVVAYTADEFKKKYPEFKVIEAADPRLSVIEWNNDGAIGSAWATAAAHPFTGLVKSADVFMTGAMWAMAGCRYQVLQTTVVGEGGTKLYTSPEMLAEATLKCEKILKDLGVIGTDSKMPLAEDDKMAAGRLMAATKASSKTSDKSFNDYDLLGSLDFKTAQSLAPKTEKLKSGIDCFREIKTTFSDLGGPIPEGLSLISPELAAKSMVRAVMVHELGHTFGLRHNFIASQTPAKMKTPVKTLEHTDSIMDYVIYGFEIVDNIKAIESTEGYKESPGLGSYDLIALAVAYNGDLSRIEVEEPTQFCTDDDTINALSPCQRYDFGKDIKQFIQFSAARSIRKLQLSGIPADPANAVTFVRNLSVDQGKLWLTFLDAYGKASASLVEKRRLEFLPDLLNLGFGKPTDTTEPWWDEFKVVHGGSIPSLIENLAMSISKFESEIVLLRRLDQTIMTSTSINGFISAAETILQQRPKSGERSLLAVVPRGFSTLEADLNLDKQMGEIFLDKIILKAGTTVEFKSATGVVQTAKLSQDLFNHTSSIAKLSVDGVEFRFAGQNTLSVMEASAKALSLMANGYSSSPSARALQDVESRLKEIESGLSKDDRSQAPLARMISLSQTMSQSAASISL
jgi:hypothetical protein